MSRRRWVQLGTALILLVMAVMLWRTLRDYSLEEILDSMARIPLPRVLVAGGFAAASYLCLTGFDWLGLRYVGRPLSWPKAALASFTSLALGHSIGIAGLSSGAIRYRFYARWGLDMGDVAKLVVFCGLTVTVGLTVLAGGAMLLRPDLAGRMTGLGESGALAVGAGALGLTLVYLGLAAVLRRPLRIRSWTLEMPSLRLALLQVLLGTVNFALVAGCLYEVLAAVAEVTWPGVAAAYAIANGTAIIAHVPGGLGVIESVVTYLLPGTRLLGALVMFRVVYYLVPLALGGALLAVSELLARYRPAALAPSCGGETRAARTAA
jgi:uncharacterized membrane protein YbhN (UPF0104 family)